MNKQGIEFDPGFAPYILVFKGTVEYLYTDINRFKNLSQKKIKFKQYYKKILDLFYNNLGFYIGCLMWATYIKSLPNCKILNNHCLNTEYNEEDNVFEVDFMLKFLELFPKDMKYFIGENFQFEGYEKQILEIYREFLIINKGFTSSQNNTDIILPNKIKATNTDEFNTIIEKVISTKDLSKFKDYKDLICQE